MTRYEIRDKMLYCADVALCVSTVWSRDRPEEEQTMTPVYTIKHMQNLIRKMFEEYKERVIPDSAKYKTYYIHVENGAPLHPIYIVGTLIVLLLAGVEKIWIEYPRSYPNSRELLKNHLVTFFIEGIVKRFPNIEEVKSNAKRQHDEVAIQFVNEHPEISHVVDIGGQVESYERLMRYRKDVCIHIPAANFIWIDDGLTGEIEIDEKLKDIAEKCDFGVMDYECFLAGDEKKFYKLGFEPERTYAAVYSWEEFLQEFIEWRVDQHVCDVMNVFCFGDREHLPTCECDYKDKVQMISEKDWNTDVMYYDFMNLLREEIW